MPAAGKQTGSGDVLQHAEVPQQMEGLEHETDVLTTQPRQPRVIHAGRVLAKETQGAGVGAV